MLDRLWYKILMLVKDLLILLMLFLTTDYQYNMCSWSLSLFIIQSLEFILLSSTIPLDFLLSKIYIEEYKYDRRCCKEGIKWHAHLITWWLCTCRSRVSSIYIIYFKGTDKTFALENYIYFSSLEMLQSEYFYFILKMLQSGTTIVQVARFCTIWYLSGCV